MTGTFFDVQLSDREVASMLWDAARAATPDGRLLDTRAVLAVAVATGRLIGSKQTLEPLDDGMRTVALAAYEQLSGTSFVGIAENLSRLNRFLERYPARGLPKAPDGEAA